MQEFWGFILVLCLAIIGGCSSVPLKDSRDDDSSLNSNINLAPYLEQQPQPQFQTFRSPLSTMFSKYHPFAFGLSRSANLIDSDNLSPSEQAYYQNQNQHQKRQTMKYHQCYFNPISCFRRRR